MGRFEVFGEDLEKLKDIAHHLVEAESHHQREEDVLFEAEEKGKFEWQYEQEGPVDWKVKIKRI